MKFMKCIFLTLALFWSSFSFALVIESDRAQYTSEDNIVLIGSMPALPYNSALEYYGEYFIGTNPVKVTKISDEYFAAVLSSLPVGSHTWTVNVYTQDKIVAKNLNASIISLNAELIRVRRLKQQETNPAKIADLNLAITGIEQQLISLKGQLSSNRTLLETGSKNVLVLAPQVKNLNYDNALFLMATPLQVMAGDSVQLSAQIYRAYLDFGMGYTISTKVAGDYVAFNQNGVDRFIYTYNSKYSDIGIQNFEVDLFVFNENAIVLIQNAILKAGVKRFEVELEKNTEINSSLKSYLEYVMADLDLILSALHGAHTQMKTLAVTKTISLQVIEPTPIVLSKSSLQVMEGQVAEYQIKVNKPPVNSVSVTIESANTDLRFAVGANTPAATLELIFDQTNWSTPQSVKVSLPDNAVVDGVRTTQITHSVVGLGYETVTVPDLPTTIIDPQVPMICNPVSINTTQAMGSSYTIVLPKAPSATVQVQITSNGNFSFSGPFGPATVSFNSTNWNIPQTVNVSSYYQPAGNYTITNSPTGDATIGSCIVDVWHRLW